MLLTTIGAFNFRCAGLVVGNTWGEWDYGAADEKARTAFRKYAGSHFQIHPKSLGELARYGLALQGGRIVDLPEASAEAAPAVPTTVPPSSPAAPKGRGR